MQRTRKTKESRNSKKKPDIKAKAQEKKIAREPEAKKEESLKEKIKEETKSGNGVKKVDIFIPQSGVQLEDVSVAEPNEPLKELAKSLENIVVNTPANKDEDEKLNYGPGGKGKSYERGKYQSARYEDVAKYEPPRLEEPTVEQKLDRDYGGMHAADKVFERFVETKKKEEEASKYKKREH